MATKKKTKKAFLKDPMFWGGVVVAALILVLVIWMAVMLLSGSAAICKPEPAQTPTVTEPPETTTEPTLPPPPANPYDPLDFELQEDGKEMVLTSGKSIKGIDVSEWQGEIDWQQVKDSGVEFVIIRVGGRGTDQGSLYADDYAQSYYEGASTAGLKVGAYFFSQAITTEEAVEEAEYALEAVKDWQLQMPIVYDWEYMGQDARTAGVDARLLTDMVKAFCDTILDAGHDTMVYFGRNHSMDSLYLEELVDYPFWLAMYSTVMDYPYRVDMWQYTDSGSVPGIAGNVDMNLLFTYEE